MGKDWRNTMAEIYGYEVKRLNEQVKRNIARFPEDFMFQLTKDEILESFLKSQIATLKHIRLKCKKGCHLGHPFTISTIDQVIAYKLLRAVSSSYYIWLPPAP